MNVAPSTGTLYLIPAGIGDPADMGTRARRLLGEVNDLYAEDTRTARVLLQSLGINRAVRSCHDANESDRANEIARLLTEGRSVGLVSEAGTPAVSDPGYRVVRAAITAGARIVPVPGPSAVLAALTGSGLPTDRFFFAGFPPRKGGTRARFFDMLARIPATLVLFESPLRAAGTLRDLAERLGDRQVCLCRELTKPHEEFVRGTLLTLAERYRSARPLGEITLVVAGSDEDAAVPEAEDLAADIEVLRTKGLRAKEITRVLSKRTGLSRKAIYAAVLTTQPDNDPPAE